MDEKELERCEQELGEAMAMSNVERALDGLQKTDPFDWCSPYRIECRLHKITVTGDYGYKQLTKALGPLYEDNSYDPRERKSVYQKKYIRNSEDFTVTIYAKPMAVRPRCYIEIVPRSDTTPNEVYKAFLMNINTRLPGLNMSKVEYATDQFCKPSLERDYEDHAYYTGRSVAKLFGAERRYLYLPFQRKAPRVYGESLIMWGNKGRMSLAFRSGRDNLYERGPNNRRTGDGWLHTDTDRVRYEHAADRPKLVKHGIGNLNAFIRNPKFYEMNKGVFRFCHFQGSRKLPGISSNYTPDQNGHYHDCFQDELFKRRKQVTNINQYIAETKYFQPLVERFIQVWQDFDRRWGEV